MQACALGVQIRASRSGGGIEPRRGLGSAAACAGRCRICGDATTPPYRLCLSCRVVASGLGRPLVPVAAIRVVGPGSGLYRALRQYKSGEPEVARRQERRLAALVGAYCARHLGALAPGGLDATVVVPSCHGNRPPPHPMSRVVAAAGRLPPVGDVLSAGPVAAGHRRPALDAYRADPWVAGRRLLLVDDVYTSGAHLQSAAAALVNAGARDVVALVVGRYARRRPGQDTDDPPRNARDTEESVSAPRGMGMGKGGRHLTDRYRNPRPWSTGNHTVRDFEVITSAGKPHTS